MAGKQAGRDTRLSLQVSGEETCCWRWLQTHGGDDNFKTPSVCISETSSVRTLRDGLSRRLSPKPFSLYIECFFYNLISEKRWSGDIERRFIAAPFSLQKGEADAISLDGGFVYTAGVCGLVPVMGESYEGKHSPGRPSGSGWWGMGWCKSTVFILKSRKQPQRCILQKTRGALRQLCSPLHASSFHEGGTALGEWASTVRNTTTSSSSLLRFNHDVPVL